MKKIILAIALIMAAQEGFTATSEAQKKEIRHLLELKVPASYILVLKGERTIRSLLDGPELNSDEKKNLKEFINSPVPRRIIPLVRGDRSLDELGLREYYNQVKVDQNI